MDGLDADGLRPAIDPLFWGMIGTPPEKQDPAKIAEARDKTAAALRMLDTQLGKTEVAAGGSALDGDIPVGLITYRFRKLVPTAPARTSIIRSAGSSASRSAKRSRSRSCRCCLREDFPIVSALILRKRHKRVHARLRRAMAPSRRMGRPRSIVRDPRSRAPRH